jgi:Glycosyltransferase family 17.
MAIYDCCIINDEIDLLKFRMSLLNSYVDFFVISELNKTFRGQDKSYKFLERIDEFDEYKDKIIYVNSDCIPEWKGVGDWSIEGHQRNCLAKALVGCDSNDIILLSDVDEIPYPSVLSNMEEVYVHSKWDKKSRINKRCLLKASSGLKYGEIIKLLQGKLDMRSALESGPVLLRMRNHYYYMNCRSNGYIAGTVICRYSNLQFPQTLRVSRYNMPCVYEGGWHFSYLGGVETIKKKLRTILDDRPEIVAKMETYSSQDEYIERCLTNGEDLFGRNDETNTFRFIKPSEVGIDNIDEYVKEYSDFFHLS